LFSAHQRARRRVPWVAVPAESGNAERYHQLVASVAKQADVVFDARAKGALSHEEALVALRRQARDLLTAIALLDERERP
jgi:hypothetical protein